MLFVEMQAPQGYPDLLQDDALVTPGVRQLKDGALSASWAFIGPDLGSAMKEELEGLSAHLNTAFIQMGDGWMMHLDLFRTPSQQYPTGGAFPDATSWLIDEERREQHEAEESHYEGSGVITLTYLPQKHEAWAVGPLFVEGGQTSGSSRTELVERFEHQLGSIIDIIGSRLRLARLEGADLLTFVHRCTTGLMHRVEVPDVPTDLDILMGSEDFTAGLEPQVGDMHLRMVAVTGLPARTLPALTAFLETFAGTIRWNTRFLCYDPVTAHKELTKYRMKWTSKVQSIIGALVEWATGAPPRYLNEDARNMAEDSNDAITLCDAGEVRFGLVTTTIVVYDRDRDKADENARLLVKELQNHGFPARVEWLNATEAFLGTLDGYHNVRRIMIHTLNLADLLPMTTIWPGLAENPNEMFPPHSPALIHAATTGATPFRLNLHVSDVGHAAMWGPIGAGKTTIFNLLIAQWFRYPNAQVRAFTRDYGSWLLTDAMGGAHYILGEEGGLRLCPLSKIHEEGERIWAGEWIENLLSVQKVTATPAQRNEISRALKLMAERGGRSLTDFSMTVQDQEIREALHPYTMDGAYGGLLDGTEDNLRESHFQTFDMSILSHAGEKQLVPVLLYLFHQVDRGLDGRATFIPIDEAWMTLLHQKFSETVERWIRTLRKKNAAVLFVTQSVADLVSHPRWPLIDESCQTKIILPNPAARDANIAALYRQTGLNDKEIDGLAAALMKKEYYYVSPLGRRMFDAGMGPIALAFTTAGSDAERRQWLALKAEHPEDWQAHWLEHRGLPEAAMQWRERRLSHA